MSVLTASDVRADLVRALEVDLIGPYKDDEQLDRAPSRFYLTGFLVPREGRGEESIVEPEDDTESEDAEGEDEDAGAEDVRPAGERADGDEEQGAMHAKCVAVDESATFITSANFTSAAQTTNVEVGVLVRDAEFTQRVGAQWRGLAARGLFRRLNG